MRRIRPYLARAAALVVLSGIALVPVLTSATPAGATATCGGTSLDAAWPFASGDQVRVPTVADAHPNEWSCDLLPSNVSGLVPVERLQIDLNDCYGQHLRVDGEYGPLTEAAVKLAQGTEHVTQDGDYGPQTVVGTSTYGGFQYQLVGLTTGFCSANATAGATNGTNG